MASASRKHNHRTNVFQAILRKIRRLGLKVSAFPSSLRPTAARMATKATSAPVAAAAFAITMRIVIIGPGRRAPALAPRW